jgi:hypothetical protein
MLGLQLPNYVPGGPPSLDAATWSGVVARQPAMLSMFGEHVLSPLLAMAGERLDGAASGPLLQGGGGAGEDRGGGWWDAWLPPAGSVERRAAVAAATVVGAALAVAAVAVVVRQRRRGGGGGGGGGPLRALAARWA